jgi:hypothetical protein
MTNFTSAVPVVATADVAGTVQFERILGFEKQWAWGDPPVYAGVRAGSAMLYISEDAELAAAIRDRQLRPDIFLWVEGIDAVYARHRASDAHITDEIADRPWGVRQYVIREPNGYSLKIVESIE